jgi:hypothetical protein
MAVVTALTAARLQQIENASVVAGNVVNGNLILSRKDGTTINAGYVQGPSGVSQNYLSGYYYGPEGGRGVTAGSVLAFGVMTMVPFFMSATRTVTSLGAAVTTAGGTSSVFRLGVYTDDGTGKPGTRMTPGTTTSVATAAGALEQAVSVSLNAGQYWLACAVQGSTTPVPVMRAVVDNVLGGAGAISKEDATLATPMLGWYQTGVTGTLPATFTGTLSTATPALVVAKVS